MAEWHTLYTSSAINCQWCTKAKELLNIYGIDFYEKDINENETYKQEFLEAGHTTVPQLYHEGTLIGGYEATERYLRLKHSAKAREEELSERLTRI
jgi:glutaredoxin